MVLLNNFRQITFKIAVCLLIATLLFNCKEEETLQPAQDYPQYTDFDKLNIGSGFRVTVQQGTARQLRISVPASDQSKLSVGQANGTLSVSIDNKSSVMPGTINIVMPSLTSIRFSGGIPATITGFSPISLPITLSGGSSVTLTGSVQTLTLDLSGGSTFNGYSFPTTDAVVGLAGGSEAFVAASKTMNVTASGGSKLFYKGTPVLTQKLTGGSTITNE